MGTIRNRRHLPGGSWAFRQVRRDLRILHEATAMPVLAGLQGNPCIAGYSSLHVRAARVLRRVT